jgi:3-deoxy-D-manno-octulosonic-acid transferase
MFRRLAKVCAQEEAYARHFIGLGAPPERVSVTGTMKFDTAPVSDAVPGAGELADAVGLRPGAERVWVCGSTGPGEEPVVLETYQRLRQDHPDLRLVIVPRKPERFDEVAADVLRAGLPLVRRSQPGTVLAEEGIAQTRADHPVVLGDTTGELLKFYRLADVVFVGRTLVDLGPRQRGSNMIEPAALARPVVVGPYTNNFTEPMRCLRKGDAVLVVHDGEELLEAVRRLLESPAEAAEMGKRAQCVVNRERGATARHAKVILEQLDAKQGPDD